MEGRDRRFFGVFLSCLALALVCLLAVMPPLWQRDYPHPEEAAFFFAGEDLIDINSAPAAELACLPGIGEKKAQAIIEYRMENGPFSSAEELADVSGISTRMVEEFQDLICFS